MSVWVGIDPGEKRIGMARADALGVLATPRGVSASKEELLLWLNQVNDDFGLAGVLVGCPRNMDGSFGPMALRSLELTRWLREGLSVPVRLWDERLTTKQAQGVGRTPPSMKRRLRSSCSLIWTQEHRKSAILPDCWKPSPGKIRVEGQFQPEWPHFLALLVSLGSIHTLGRD